MLFRSPVARKGAWVDEMVFTSIDEAPNAVAQLQANAIDYYAYQVEDADVFKTVKDDPNLAYSVAYGSFDSLLFNPSGPTFQDGRLNPFSNQKIREAVNWMLDRDYLVQETVGGLGIPKWVVLIQAYPDYPRFADIIRPIEAKYAFNMAKADEVLTAEMTAMGATKVDGKWQFNGSPVVIIGLIRSEDEREEIGNYFADRLEELGFTVDRQVRTRSELSPIWQQSDPTEGQWHYYTAGNGYPVVVRNAGYFFDEFYMPRGDTTTTSQAYAPTAEFDEVALKLSTNDYTSLEERSELFKRALSLSLENSQYVFNIGTYSFYPRKANLIVSSDLGGGANMSALYPYTIRWEGQEGGTVRIAQSGILFGPWNAIAGNNWVQDLMMVKATYDDAVLSDPFTGLFWTQRLQRAEVVAQEGLPMTKTLDWIDLKFAPEIKVPSDAWVDWDAKNQKFITAAEKFP